MIMEEENYISKIERKMESRNKFIATLGFLTSISYLLRLAECGIDISNNDKLNTSGIEVFKRHFE